MMRVIYPDKCFVLFIIRVIYLIVRVIYPDKEVKRLHWEFTTPVKGIHYGKGNSPRQWKEFITVKGIRHINEGGR